MSKLIVYSLCLSGLFGLYGVSLAAQLYPYGSNIGDKVHPKQDDACNNIYNQRIVMFGKQFNRLYVCTNGDISLGSGYTAFTPLPFPLSSDTTLICPFWADGDPRVGGNVYSRITRDSTLLGQISAEVRSAYSTDRSFKAKWLLVATWAGVKAFGAQQSSTKINTFQAIVASDDINTFVLYIYDKIQYGYGSESNGIHAQVGFDSGDGRNFYATPESRTSAILSMPSRTNIGVPGKMLYKLSNAIYDTPKFTPGVNVTADENGTVPVYTTPGPAILLPDLITTGSPLATTTQLTGPRYCRDMNLTQYLVASRYTGVADLVLGLAGDAGYEYKLTLPPGRYPLNITFQPNSLNCLFDVTVYSADMRRRVDVEAEYNVTCEAYRHSLTNNIMMTVAEQRYSVIEHLCGGLCHRPSLSAKPIFSCSRNVLTVRWPTDLTVTADQTAVPSALTANLLKRAPLLDLLIVTRKPPVVYPMRTGSGALASLKLTPYCLTGTYDIGQDQCV